MTSIPSYDALLDALRDISSDERTTRTHDRERRKVHTYWYMGDAIHAHVLDHEGRAEYGDQVVARLANDLSMDRSLLYLILQFRQSFPTVDTYPGPAQSRSVVGRRPPVLRPSAGSSGNRMVHPKTAHRRHRCLPG